MPPIVSETARDGSNLPRRCILEPMRTAPPSLLPRPGHILTRKMLDPENVERIEAAYHRLAEQWMAETAPLSSIRRKKQHPAYRPLVELGEPAIPFILAA